MNLPAGSLISDKITLIVNTLNGMGISAHQRQGPNGPLNNIAIPLTTVQALSISSLKGEPDKGFKYNPGQWNLSANFSGTGTGVSVAAGPDIDQVSFGFNGSVLSATYDVVAGQSALEADAALFSTLVSEDSALPVADQGTFTMDPVTGDIFLSALGGESVTVYSSDTGTTASLGFVDVPDQSSIFSLVIIPMLLLYSRMCQRKS